MSPRRFFVERVAQDADGRVVLTGREAHHAATVLRLQPGDCVELRDGCGRSWKGDISRVDPGAVHVCLAGQNEAGAESALKLTLALAYARLDRMELVLRQATELGVSRVLTFRAQRSQYGLSPSQAARRMERWQRIAREALCQCGRSVLPEIVFLPGIRECIEAADADMECKEHPGEGWGREERQRGVINILASEMEHGQSLLSLRDRFPAAGEVVVTVGPEGGWTREETDRFLESGFHQVHLGPRILRLETAASAFLTAAQLLWGDFGTSSEEAIRP